MRILAEGFWLPKADNTPEEYEDAFSPADKYNSETPDFRCAIADGAAQTIFSGKWARLLVSGFCNGSPFSDKLSERISPLQSEWLRHVTPKRPLPWYAEEKVAKGAYAALLGLEVSTMQLSGKVEGIWQSTAVGDCCLFQIRHDDLITRFPLLTASEFTNSPSLISTNNDANVELNDFATGVCGKWEIDDCFLLMSDAIACWFLKAFEAGEKPWNTIRDLGTGNTPRFSEWVADLRNTKRLRNDDVTILVVRIEP
jgi:hypothetical protein